MRVSAWKLLSVILLLGVAAARADDFRANSSQRMDAILEQQQEAIGQLQAELTSLRRELAQAVRAPEGGAVVHYPPQPPGNSGFGATCCNDINSKCVCSYANTDCDISRCKPEPLAFQAGIGWFAYGEALIVRPFSTFGTATQGNFNLTATPRITLGRVVGSGFGVRARYWTFNDFANTNDLFFLGNVFRNQIQTHVLDLEATDRIRLGNWILTGSLGLRYVSYLNRFTDPAGALVAPGGLIARNKVEALGIVGGLDFQRPITYRWSFYGNTRFSVLTGKTSFDVVLPANLHSTTESITELGGGIQYNRSLRNERYLVARGGYEAQYWNGFGDIGAFGLGQSTSFAGLTFGAGISF